MPSVDSGVAIVLPTFCEREALPGLLDRLLRLPVRVCVVDDSSPDGTADLVRERQRRQPRLMLLERPFGSGRGPAVIAAVQWLLGTDGSPGPRLIVEMDADGSHDPDAVESLVASAATEADVVLGSRHVRGGRAELSGPRRLLSRMANVFARRVLGLPYRDCSTGFRCYRTSALCRVDLETLRCAGHATHIELLHRLHRAGARIAEVPIHYRPRQGGRSKVRLRTVGSVLLQLLDLRVRRRSFRSRRGASDSDATPRGASEASREGTGLP